MGGYAELIVYQQSGLIFDLTYLFCQLNLADQKHKRTVEQMQQAARSGKQNITEGSLEKSTKLSINLTSVSRASFGELLEDFKDYLRLNGLNIWPKDDPRLESIRNLKISASNERRWSNMANWTKWTKDPERFANLMITLICKETYLLDKMISSIETKFVDGGGYTENLRKRRIIFRQSKKHEL